MVCVSLTEEVGILLLFPLLQLIGFTHNKEPNAASG
jgi:hypothetical protein